MTIQHLLPPPTSHHTAAQPGDVPQLRLPGQAAAPEGPVNMMMMYLAHHAFRRDLRTFAAAVPLTPVDDRGAWRAMVARWATFSLVLHMHHETEDAWLWPALMLLAEDHEKATLRDMEDEHATIDPLLQACRAGLERMVTDGTAADRAGLGEALVAARDNLGHHLAHEESESIAMIQRTMSQADWEEVDRHFQEHMTLSFARRAVPWALLEVPAEVRDHVFAGPGGGPHRVMWLLTRRGFARQHARAFAHLPGQKA